MTMKTSRKIIQATLVLVVGLFVTLPSHDALSQSASDCIGLSQQQPSTNTPSPYQYCMCEIDSSYCLSYGVGHTTNPRTPTPEEACENQNNRIWTSEGCMTCWSLAQRVGGSAALFTSLVPGAGSSFAAFSTLAVYAWCVAFN